jgi:VWFA-related protein
MKTHLLGAAVVCALAGAAAGQNGSSAQPPPSQPEQPAVTFRAEVNYVEVDARVVDAQGEFVPNLTARDFQLFEDGAPQEISVFSLVNIPVERARQPLFADRPIEPDVHTNASAYEGRVYLIVLDDLHTTPLLAQGTKRAAREFVERHMGANDVAAVVHTSGRLEASQEFTSNKRLILEAIDKFSGRKLRSALLGRLEVEYMTRGMRENNERIDDPDAFERGYNARIMLEALRDFARVMENVRGRRKALVLFSEGIDYDIADPFNNRDATTILDMTREVIAAATRANVALYGIDVRGLGAGSDIGIEIQSYPEDPNLGLDSRALQQEIRLGQDSLRVLSEQTGGFAAVNTNDIDGAFERLVEENSAYYVLGYYSRNERRDGRFRRIEVRVDRPGVTVRARRGYVAPRGRPEQTRLAGPRDASEELREAMSSPVPVSGLFLASTAGVFKGPDGKGSVIVSTLVGGRDLPLAEKNGTFHNDLEIAWLAIDQKGATVPGDRNTIALSLKPDTLKRVRAAGFRVISSLELPPGRYQLRVAAREGTTRRSGSVLVDLEVPDFSTQPLAMSSIALTSTGSSVAPTARSKDPLATLLPGPLTTYREFTTLDELALFAEVYENGRQPPHKVDIAVTLSPEGGAPVFQTRQTRDSAELQGQSGGYGVSARIPLRDIPPGVYVLKVEAQLQIADRPSVSRETIVRVVAPPGTGASGGPRADAAAGTATGGDAGSAPERKGASGVSSEAAAAAPQTSEGPVQVTIVDSDTMSGIDRPEQVVVRSREEWEALWGRHAPSRPLPVIDFARQTVIAIFLGSRPSAGYRVEITGVRPGRDGALIVQWAERRPLPGQVAAQVMTSPAQIVAVPRHEGEVRFEKSEQ